MLTCIPRRDSREPEGMTMYKNPGRPPALPLPPPPSKVVNPVPAEDKKVGFQSKIKVEDEIVYVRVIKKSQRSMLQVWGEMESYSQVQQLCTLAFGRINVGSGARGRGPANYTRC